MDFSVTLFAKVDEDNMLRIAIICGGPSLERGISLNSARSVLDHLPNEKIIVIPLFVDQNCQFYSIASAQMYSNTPADFDFKLEKIAKQLDKSCLLQLLRSVNLVFPVIHGAFGEDGELQKMLEEWEIPFIGHDSACCRRMFHKHTAANLLHSQGFPVFPSLLIQKNDANPLQQIEEFFTRHHLHRAVVKPESGGSSIGVSSVNNPQEVYKAYNSLFDRHIANKVLIEPFCEGIEFTIVVFENYEGNPVALIPTEIEICYQDNQIFDYRKKYLPTANTFYHTPARFREETIQDIRQQAEKIFQLFGMRDFARLDGWLKQDGTIYFTDLNPISGMEQNSFLFRQSTLIGMTHRQTLHYIVKQACRRYGIPFVHEENHLETPKKPVYVLFGGGNAERQVSLLSGTNVWLKLLSSDFYDPVPYFYDSDKRIWKLPYHYTLNHTVEEIYAACIAGKTIENQTLESIQSSLGISLTSSIAAENMHLNAFFDDVKRQNAFVFIALHGGEGENGTFQKFLEAEDIVYNGSDAQASAICMDKLLTSHVICHAADKDIHALPKQLLNIAESLQWNIQDYEKYWLKVCQELNTNRLIVKPRSDGCSAGIVILESALDLQKYCRHATENKRFILPLTFAHQYTPIEMPSDPLVEYLLEPYIETDRIAIENHTLFHTHQTGWIELTVGVLEQNGVYYALNPSITVAEGAILSLEEKFQGGTGVNITPPPENIISSASTKKIRSLIEKTAQILKIRNYARIDIFYNRFSDQMIVIEANSLPGLTPSTVIYHQALAEPTPLTPKAFLEKIISSKINSIIRD
jgi:D-alanine--D-alanine ligase